MNKIHAALDFSGPQAVFAVEKDGNKIFEVSKLMQRRDAASFAEFLQSNLKAHGLDFADITHWTVGSGPGSFTGMRIAASFVQGLTYGKDVQTRTVPSAEAIAASAGLQKENACIIFDGRNKEIILLDLKNGKDAILNKEQSVEYFKENKFDFFAAMEYDRKAVELIVPQEVFAEIKWAPSLDTDAFFQSGNVFDNNLTNLIYIRPSVAGAKE